MNTTTRTGTKVGTLMDFIEDRKLTCPKNVEQYEAFSEEFYGMVEQIVQARENAFSLQSQITFPRFCRSGDTIVAFTVWVLEYQHWILGLFDFEKRTLAHARVTWD